MSDKATNMARRCGPVPRLKFQDALRLLQSGVPAAEIARRFGISRGRVSQMVGLPALLRRAAREVRCGVGPRQVEDHPLWRIAADVLSAQATPEQRARADLAQLEREASEIKARLAILESEAKLRKEAKALWFNLDLTAAQIAEKAGYSARTMYRWWGPRTPLVPTRRMLRQK